MSFLPHRYGSIQRRSSRGKNRSARLRTVTGWDQKGTLHVGTTLSSPLNRQLGAITLFLPPVGRAFRHTPHSWDAAFFSQTKSSLNSDLPSESSTTISPSSMASEDVRSLGSASRRSANRLYTLPVRLTSRHTPISMCANERNPSAFDFECKLGMVERGADLLELESL